MYYKGKFAGSIIINGKVDSDTVSVVIFESGSVQIGAGQSQSFSRKTLTISPFTKYMIFTQDPKRMTEGFYYEISGTEVGAYSEGPLGHPGDGEFAVRPLRSVRITVEYWSETIVTTITGKTDEGSSPFASGILPWEFVIQFEIKKTEIQEFFKLSDFVCENVYKLFDKYCARA
ncbi:MAG: hypothetical protein CVV05_05355 [Gammaproteobacteria bacterium HGW-Gammaproteobacteria-1]|jgi:hypothetical protein|nr:MAG: hypothetical protein CVV05_05355 [Gammaproteobacteria bacterium HGW-Gammaproteobacteria-1]